MMEMGNLLHIQSCEQQGRSGSTCALSSCSCHILVGSHAIDSGWRQRQWGPGCHPVCPLHCLSPRRPIEFSV